MSVSNGLFPESLQEIVREFKPQTPFELTVGCEIEFILVYRKNDPDDEELTYKQCVNIIRAAFEKPIEVVCQWCGGKDRFILPLNEYDTSDRDKWEVELEGLYEEDEPCALGRDQRDYYGFKGMELKSRILGKEACHQKKCCRKDVTIDEEITAVLGRLKSSFRTLRGNGAKAQYFIYVNQSCGFHIHLRINEPEKSELWSLSSLQKILSLQIACERQLDSMHAAERINGFKFDQEIGLREKPFPGHPVLDQRTYNHPLSMFFMADADRKRRRDKEHHGDDPVRTGYEIDESKASISAEEDDEEHLNIWLARRLMDIDSWILRVRRTEDLEDMVKLSGQGLNGKRCVFNMKNVKLDSMARPKSDTVEFRQCRGTLSATKVTRYLSFVMQMAVYCHLVPEDEFYSLIGSQGAFRKPRYTIFNLLERIRCSNVTKTYFTNQLDLKIGAWSKPLIDDRQYMESIMAHEPLAALASAILKHELESVDPQLSEERIRFKLTYGGYGHFSQDYLESAPLNKVSFKDRRSVIEHLRLSDVEPINDGPAEATGTLGVNATGYGEVHSDDSDPQLTVRRSELPPRIKRILIDKERGAYKPRLSDASQAFQPRKKARPRTPPSPSLSELMGLTLEVSQLTASEASLSAGEDMPIREKSKSSIRRGDRGDWSDGESRGRSGGHGGGRSGGDSRGRKLPRERGSGSLSGSVDSSRQSSSGRRHKA